MLFCFRWLAWFPVVWGLLDFWITGRMGELVNGCMGEWVDEWIGWADGLGGGFVFCLAALHAVCALLLWAHDTTQHDMID